MTWEELTSGWKENGPPNPAVTKGEAQNRGGSYRPASHRSCRRGLMHRGENLLPQETQRALGCGRNRAHPHHGLTPVLHVGQLVAQVQAVSFQTSPGKLLGNILTVLNCFPRKILGQLKTRVNFNSTTNDTGAACVHPQSPPAAPPAPSLIAVRLYCLSTGTALGQDLLPPV